ncbi:MAG: hypothetical protein JWP82_1261 [Humibacillus sp.]|nr:hypothetical protein [Humibacillus sp.]
MTDERPAAPLEATLPTLDVFGEALGAASTVLRANAVAAGLEAAVPTCPGWSVRDLVVHQGMVHRWATSRLRVEPGAVGSSGSDDPAALEAAGREAADLLGWFDEGANALLQALVDAPDDLAGRPFLLDAPAPRLFWARRQCHETTVHAVDALAARLGRVPDGAETWIRAGVALDGIDELLTGFVPRPRQGVTHDDLRVLVAPLSSTRAWLLDLAPDRPPVVERLDLAPGRAVPAHGAVLTGEPVELYLRLWNRGGEPRDELERWWADAVSVRW